MEFSAQQIADLLEGTIEGNPEAKVNNLSKIEEGKPGTLSFLANPKYTSHIYTTDASVVIVNNDLVLEQSTKDSLTMIRVENAYECFAKLLNIYDQIRNDKKGVEQPSFISKNAIVGEDCYVGAFAYIGDGCKVGNNVKIYPNSHLGDNVTIGDNTTIFAGTKIYSDTIIGTNCTIHAGAVIGADGFGFVPDENGVFGKVAQIGNVIIEDNVDIGANTCVDRATMGSTVIKKGVKIDNLVQIAHNVEVGENSAIAGQSGIAGSAKIGERCMFGGQVGITGHVNIADGVKMADKTGVTKSINKENSIFMGYPHMEIGDFRRSTVLFRQFPQLKKQIDALTADIDTVKQTLEE